MAGSIFVAALGCGAVGGALPPPLPAEVSGDSALFEMVVRRLLLDSLHGPPRVDPRPLRDDPELVTLHRTPAMVGDRIRAGREATPFAEGAAAELALRRAILARLGIVETDALSDARCPGVLHLAPPDEADEKALRCPRVTFRSVAVGRPRSGGAWWPRSVDERRKYEGRPVASVRVITRAVGPDGSVESTADHVFEERERARWELLEIRRLLIVE